MKPLLVALLVLLAPALRAATGDVYAVSVEANGYVADLYMSSLTTGGTYVYGFGQSNSISGSGSEKLVVTVSSPGYDDAGASNGLVRKIYGVLVLRKPYNSQATADEKSLSADLKSRIVLSDRICANDTIQSLSVGAGFYTDTLSKPSLATNFTSNITNLSGLNPPRALAMWSQPGYFLVGSNYTLSVVAFHYSGQQRRPVRAVAFWAKDNAGHTSVTNFVLNPTIDRTQSDALPVIEYIATIDGSGFSQGAVITNYFAVYPWWGPSLDSSDGVNPPGSADYCPQINFCDKTGDWRKVYSLVDPAGNNATAKAVTNLAQWTDGTSKPFVTIADAINAAGATNNTINGSNTLSACFIGLTNGSYDVWGGPSISSRNDGTTWVTIQARPDVAAFTNVILSTAANSLTMDPKNRVRIFNLDCKVSAFANTFGQGYEEVLIDKCLVNTNNNGVDLVASYTNLWLRQTTFWGQRQMSNPSANQAKSWQKMRGCTLYNFDAIDGRTTALRPVLAIGNNFPCTGNEQYGFVNDSGILVDPGIWAYNFMGRQNGLQYPMTVGINADLKKGFAIVQNVIETTVNAASSVTLDIMFSAKENEVCTNLLAWNNTILGTYHPPFVQQAGTNITEEWYQDLNNIYGGLQAKADVSGTSSLFTNRWCDTFSVGRVGNGNANYLQTGTQPDGTEKGFNGLSSWFFSATNAQAFLFVNNAGQSTVGGSGSGLGNYNLLTEHPMRGIRLAVVMPYDLAGNPRGELDPPGAYCSASPRKGAMFFAQ